MFLAPAFVLLGVFFFIPFFQTIFLSFLDYSNSIYEPVWTGFGNYAEILRSSLFLKTILNTFWFMILCVPFLVVSPLFLAVLINQKIRGITLYKLIIYLPVIISIVVVAIAFKWLYAQNGLLNYALDVATKTFELLHLPLRLPPVGWLTDPRVAMVSIAIVTIFKGVGYYMMIYLAALMSVPRELYEASEIDGANEWQKHMNVTLPHLMPTIALVATISSISALKVFVEIYVMTKGGPLDSTKTIVYYIYERAFENLDLGVASAASVILLIIVMAFSIVNIFCFERKKYDL